jgi:hypothetical protein
MMSFLKQAILWRVFLISRTVEVTAKSRVLNKRSLRMIVSGVYRFFAMVQFSCQLKNANLKAGAEISG